MRVKFLVDYVGRETAMKQYAAGDVAEFGTEAALELLRLNVAIEFEVEQKPKRKTKEVIDEPNTY